jgi:D-alanyl-D-alanine carboxypeptidase (penicillin-binding protein 5/6)
MNARAAALGLPDTHYANPCGHDDPAQYTSARDIAVLSRVVLADPVLAAAAQRREIRIATAQGRVLAAHSTNALLADLRGARGLKTGTTPAAGRCLVAVVERDGHRVLAVLLHAPERWWDSVGLVELAFEASASIR